MKGTALIYRPGTPEPEEKELTAHTGLLELLQGAVGGYLEAVPGFLSIPYHGVRQACVAFCNEDGKREPLPLNATATELWHQALAPPGLRRGGGLTDWLVGPVVVVLGDREFMEEL